MKYLMTTLMCLFVLMIAACSDDTECASSAADAVADSQEVSSDVTAPGDTVDEASDTVADVAMSDTTEE